MLSELLVIFLELKLARCASLFALFWSASPDSGLCRLVLNFY